EEDYYDFYDVYKAIKKALDCSTSEEEDYYVVFEEDRDKDHWTELCDDDNNVSDRYEDGIYLDEVEYLYLDVDPDDDYWEGYYEVYDDYDDELVLEGDITI